MKKNYTFFYKNISRFCFENIRYFGFLIAFFFVFSTYGQFAKVELANGMTNTTTFKFAPDGRIFILDRYGEILIYENSVGVPVSGGTIPVFHDLEDGLLAIAFDLDFANNNLIYLYYSPAGYVGNRVSQFTMTGGTTLDLSSEVTLLEWPTNRVAKFHSGGDMDFDSQGNLYISTGDNTSYPNTYTAISLTNTNTAANEIASAEKSSANTNDLRGKILRIKPSVTGTYSIPAGNLFPGGTGGLPEIYVMGARNPYRIFVDKTRNDWLFWGEVGPDAQVADVKGPIGYDEINLTKAAGNYGWPYFSGKNNEAYQVPYNGMPAFYNNPLAPVNTSIFNTGATNLPPAQPALMAYGGYFKCLLAGFRYDYDANQTDVQRLPIEFDDAFFFFDFNRSIIFYVNLDANGNVIEDDSDLFTTIPGFASSTFPTGTEGFIDMELGPDGKMYILAYGVPCCGTDAGPTGKLYRVDYTGITTNSPPVIELAADQTNGNLPLVVNFSTAGTSDPNGDSPLTYSWDFDGDGLEDDNTPNPTHTFTTAGTINVQLKVDDGNAVNSQSIKNITIYAGNNIATFTVNSPVNGGFFNWGDDVDIDIVVQDAEDGLVNCTNATLIPGFGHLTHVHPELSDTTCPQTINIVADASHGTEGELDVFGSFSLEYVDTGGLISRDLILLHPKRKEAEFYDTQSGTTIIGNNNPLEGGGQALRVDAGGYISFSGRNLINMTAVKYSVAAAAAGSTIEMRIGSPTGPLVATTVVPSTGDTSTWVSVETNITDPGGRNDLFFVFTGSGSAIFDLNYVEFLGDGTSTDTTPPTIEKVSALNATTVAIQFSEYLDPTTAENGSNYAINNAVSISAAVLQSDSRTVFLTVSPLNSTTTYNVIVSNVQNTSGFAIATNSNPFTLIGDVRINAGGPQVTWLGNAFIADQYGAGGTVFTSNTPIDGTVDDALYQTEIFGPANGFFSYEIPVGINGAYDIRLHFAELFFGVGNQTGGAGSRVFDVSIEGTTVLSNFDILSEVSSATALTKEFNDILVNDGSVSIQFTGITQSAKINGIEVLNKNTFGEPTNSNITITSPSNGWDVNQPFDVAFNVENWTILEGDTHVHYYIDDVMVGPYYSYEPISIDDLSLGEHTIKVELFLANHTETGIFDEVTVNVTGAITCNETPFPDQWGLKQLETTPLPHRSVYTFADYDLDGDGLKDIVTGGWWYKNPGTIAGNWQRSDIGSLFDNVAYVYDFDNDGDLDLLGVTSDDQSPVGYTGAKLVWAQNDGQGGFTVFTNIPEGDTNYSEPFLAGIAGGVFSVGGDYQMAINWNGAESTNSPMQMLTPSPNPETGMWSLVDMSGAVSTGEDLQVGDIDQDNDLDLFQGSNWIRNNNGSWSTHSTGITYPTTPDRAQLADFNRNGRLDAVVGQLSIPSTDPEFSQFAWFENPMNLGTNPDQPWVRNILATDINGSLSVFATDIDFDGDMDIVVGEWRGQHRLMVFENNLCVDGTFDTQIINIGGASSTLEHHDGARVTDLDNDGDLDIISNGWVNNLPRIYENETAAVQDDRPIVNAGVDQNISPGAATLNGSASDPDGGVIASYVWTQTSGPSTATLAGDDTVTLTASDLVEGVYVFRLTATDDESDTAFDEATITIGNIIIPVPDAIIINAGGPTYTFDTTTWSADQYFNGGNAFSNEVPIANTENDALYQTERFSTLGPLVYEIPVSNGSYNVDLHFAEIYYGVGSQAGGVGSRVFNIQVENETQIDNYDIVSAAGGSATAIIESLLNVVVTDGVLTITLTSVTEFPKISGIEVIEISEPIVNAGEDQTVVLPANTITLNGTGSDPDGGEVTYQWTQEDGPAATLSGVDTADLAASDLVEGVYTFRLTVTDDENTTAFDEVIVTVGTEGSMSQSPVAVAEADLVNGGSPLLVLFTGSNSTDDVGVVSYLWDFGDGTTSTEADPEKEYMVSGVYEVTLTVTDAGGLTDTVTITVPFSSRMSIVFETNPPNPLDEGFAKIVINNKPIDVEVMNITIHDVGGRYISGYTADEIAAGNNYELPISTLRDGLYFVRIVLNKGDSTLMKLLISN